jgi:hypothetical protein
MNPAAAGHTFIAKIPLRAGASSHIVRLHCGKDYLADGLLRVFGGDALTNL